MRKAILFLILISPILLFSQQPYVATENEELYGTWVNTEYPGRPFKFQKIVYRPDGTYEIYLFAKDASPLHTGVFRIVEKWTDSARDIFYKEHFSVPDHAGDALDRISKDGTVFETLFYRSGYKPRFPTKIDPNDVIGFYLIYYRQR